MSVVSNERPWSSVSSMGEDYAAVSKEQLQRLAKGCADNSIVTMLGPKEVIEPQLKEKGIEYEIVDWKTRGDEILAKYDPKAAAKKKKAKAKADAKKAKKEAKEAKKKKAKGGADAAEEGKDKVEGASEEKAEAGDEEKAEKPAEE